jgi:hypothetical protein
MTLAAACAVLISVLLGHGLQPAFAAAEGNAAAVANTATPEAPGAVEDPIVAQARAAFAATHTVEQCGALDKDAFPDGPPVEAFDISYNFAADDPAQPKRPAKVIRFLCFYAAYNQIDSWYLWEEIDGLRELHFAAPELDITYENGDFEGKVEEIRIIGYKTQSTLVNSEFDPETLTLSEFSKWRGVADASSTASWIFRDGNFTLVKYDVDASYDGEINPQTVFDLLTGP